MKKILLVVLIFSISINASNLIKDEKLNLVDDKDFVIRCINGYKWIQFVKPVHGKGGTYYVPSENPQQMFERYNWGKDEITMLPVVCDK